MPFNRRLGISLPSHGPAGKRFSKGGAGWTQRADNRIQTNRNEQKMVEDRLCERRIRQRLNEN